MTMNAIMRALPLGALALGLSPCDPAAGQGMDLSSEMKRDLPALLAIYRKLHGAPELSFREHGTAALLATSMRELGFAVTPGVGRTGVVAVLRNGPGPTILLRTDMDALPVTERTGLPFASNATVRLASGATSGVMHACGHDTHMAAWLGAARLLAVRRRDWLGTLVMIAQPAEETDDGAKAMLRDGLFKRFPRPDYAIAIHNSATLPAGQVGYAPGYAMAAVDSVDLTVRGIGGHGASPQSTRDPIVLASRIVTTLQTLVSRELDPQDAAVVTVGSIQGGTQHNIIPPEVKLQLTVRSFAEATRMRLLDGIRRVARGEAIAAGVPEDLMPVVHVSGDHLEAVFNDEQVTGRLVTRLGRELGEDRVARSPPVMGGEDFAQYRLADPARIRSVLFWIGGVPRPQWEKAKGDLSRLPSLHSPFWAPDAEAVIGTGAQVLAFAALELMERTDTVPRGTSRRQP